MSDFFRKSDCLLVQLPILILGLQHVDYKKAIFLTFTRYVWNLNRWLEDTPFDNQSIVYEYFQDDTLIDTWTEKSRGHEISSV